MFPEKGLKGSESFFSPAGGQSRRSEKDDVMCTKVGLKGKQKHSIQGISPCCRQGDANVKDLGIVYIRTKRLRVDAEAVHARKLWA